jgi:hypothetical protein
VPPRQAAAVAQRSLEHRLPESADYDRAVDPLAILGALIVTLTGAAMVALAKWVRLRQWLRGVFRRPKSEFPVRLTCTHETAFDPGSGYHEGLQFEVFNHSDKPVRIKGFGLKLRMSGRNGEWFETEQARSYRPAGLPAWLQPNDGLEGYLDYECVGDRLHELGLNKQLAGTRPYVEVLGFGERTVEIITGSAR